MNFFTRCFKGVQKASLGTLGELLPHGLRRRLLRALSSHHERIVVRGHGVVHKWNNLDLDHYVPTAELLANPHKWGKPEVLVGTPNLITNEGEEWLIYGLTGLSTVTSTNVFNNTNARLGVGDSNTAATETQTDLVAATNKLRDGMETSYPSQTAQSVDFRSQFGTSQANFAWEEWGLFNAATAGSMFNRKVETLGTKASGSTWTLTATFDFEV
jgi:hypothetical protein